jgi:LysR family transcriptional regulator, low CO2-responsive transcriptional regulator
VGRRGVRGSPPGLAERLARRDTDQGVRREPARDRGPSADRPPDGTVSRQGFREGAGAEPPRVRSLVMTLTQLRTFLAVAETGSVRAAAERLVVTQAAVSSCIAALQKDLGLSLVSRDGRGLRLTDAGEIYSGYVRGVLGLLDEAQTAAAGEADGGRLRIAAVTTAGEQLLPELLAGFRREHPSVGAELEVGNRERVWKLLADHEADLVLGGRPPRGHRRPEMTIHAMRPNPLVVVCHAAAVMDIPKAPAGEAAGVLSWLARRTWLLREHGSGTRATTEAFFDELELAPSTLTVGSNVAVCASVAAGLGVTLISRDAVARELDSGALAELPTPATPLRRDWCLVSRFAAGDRLPAAARLFVQHVLRADGFRPPPRV